MVFVIGKTLGHLNESLFEREILKEESKKNPPKVDLLEEKKHGEFVRELIEASEINACHDISDGGLLVALFEMCGKNLGCEIDLSELKVLSNIDENHLFFGEDQSRYIVAIEPHLVKEFKKKAEVKSIPVFRIATVIKEKIKISDAEIEVAQIEVRELQFVNQTFLSKKFS